LERGVSLIKLSAIILTKNAEEVLADCIDSVSFCDEVIVIDDSSTDRTPDLAKHMGAHVFQNDSKSFAEKRNFGLKKAKGKWVLYVDSDERVSPELKASILDIISDRHSGKRSASRISQELEDDVRDSGQARMTNVSAYRIKRKNFYYGDHEWPYIEKLERLFKKSKLVEWYGDLHETAKVDGTIEEIEEGVLLHYTRTSITAMVNKTIQWSEVEADLRLKAHHPKMTGWRFFRVMFTGFYGSYIKQEGWRAGTAGLVESIYQSFSMFITYARLWELQQKTSSEK
jgi:(heptosyl)LPS beta-1,4-glucosyltransferase